MIVNLTQAEAEWLLNLASKRSSKTPWAIYAKLLAAAGKSIRSNLAETPANEGVKAPSGFEPLFPSAEPKADR